MATRPNQATITAHHIAHHLRCIATLLTDPAVSEDDTYPSAAILAPNGESAHKIAATFLNTAEELEQKHPFEPLTGAEKQELWSGDMDVAGDMNAKEIAELVGDRLLVDEVVDYIDLMGDDASDDEEGE